MMSFAGAFAVALAIAAVAFDWGTRIELNVSVLYSLPLVFAAVARRRRLLWILATILIVTTIAVYLSQAPAAASAARHSFLIDRVLSAISIALSASILDALLRSLQVRDRQDREIRRQNERLEALSHRKTQLLASISHDIRSPIQAITTMAEVIRRTAEMPDQLERIPMLAQRMQSHAISAVDFLSEVIDFASFDTGQVAIHDSEFELDELVALQCERVLPIAESKGLQLVIDPCRLRLRTDRVKLGRIIGNLIGNAIKFTSQGSINVSCGVTETDQVFIRITDTGRGIKPEDLNRIFADFAQFDQSLHHSGDGWGMGLAISRRMVKLLGGHIDVESESGKGSAFTIVLAPSSLVDGSGTTAWKCFLGRSS